MGFSTGALGAHPYLYGIFQDKMNRLLFYLKFNIIFPKIHDREAELKKSVLQNVLKISRKQ